MAKMHIKKGDKVILLTGKDEHKKTPTGKRREGKVLEVSPKEGKAIVEGFNIVTKHLKPTRENQAGGSVMVESPIRACKLQVVCPQCGQPARTGRVIENDGDKNVKKRVCKKCSKSFD
jgi:large subunit ribosomal protein L24